MSEDVSPRASDVLRTSPSSPHLPAQRSSVWPYLVAVVACLTLGLMGILAIIIWLPEHQHETLTGYIKTSIMPTIFAILAFLKSKEALVQTKETHNMVNSRLDAFIATAAMNAEAMGREKGIQQGTEAANLRTDALRAEEVIDPQRHEVTLHSPPLEALLGIPPSEARGMSEGHPPGKETDKP